MIKLKKVPVTIFTGFLGSGKTTLIKELFKQTSPPTKYCFIINEFGKIDIDAQTIQEQQCNTKDCLIKELPNGCICCTIEEDFIPTIQAIIERIDTIDHLIIETSGLALPKPLIEAFLWAEIKRYFTVDATCVVVDASALLEKPTHLPQQKNTQFTLKHNKNIQELLGDQLICSDIVILNKLEALSAMQIDGLKKNLKPLIQPNSKFFEYREKSSDLTTLIAQNIATEERIHSIKTQHDHHHEKNNNHQHAHDYFTHYLIETSFKSKKDLENWLQDCLKIEQVYRVKGYAHIQDEKMRLCVQGTGNTCNVYFDQPWQTTPATKLVVIAENTFDLDKKIQSLSLYASEQR